MFALRSMKRCAPWPFLCACLEALGRTNETVETGFVDLIGEEAWSTARIPSLGLHGVMAFPNTLVHMRLFVNAVPRNVHVQRILVMLSASHGARQVGLGECSAPPAGIFPAAQC